ncbi:hypothetical protein BGZ51_008021, partial [Haplosporangium sp. Z 767]
ARSLGYLVVDMNEYYTSKKCPTCHNFVAQAESVRRLYCCHCKKFMHRDVMAGHNICNAALGHLEHQQRLLYLQPVTTDGSYPWIQQDGKKEPACKTAGRSPGGGRKRATATDDDQDQGTPLAQRRKMRQPGTRWGKLGMPEGSL